MAVRTLMGDCLEGMADAGEANDAVRRRILVDETLQGI